MLWDIVIIAACVLAALAFLFLVTRTSAAHARKESNDFTGAVVAVIGTTYAVILAFMLSGVWNMLQTAQANAEQEANALVNIWRIGGDIQPDLSHQMRSLCLKYAEDVVKLEWPAMEAKQPMPPDSREAIQGLWKLAGQSQAHAGLDSIASYQLLEELRTLSECRRIRLMHSQEELPGILRAVLIAGGIITVAACVLLRRAELSVPSAASGRADVSDFAGAGGDCRSGPALPGERNRATDRIPVWRLPTFQNRGD